VKAKINVFLKPGILDPQGKTVLNAIEHLDYSGIQDVRIGKSIEIEFATGDKAKIKRDTEEICQKLLANPVMENWRIEFEE